MAKMTAAEFDKMMGTRRIGERQSGMKKRGRLPQALRLHLVEGVPVREAAMRSGKISPQAVYRAVANLFPKEGKKKRARIDCERCKKLNAALRTLVASTKKGSTMTIGEVNDTARALIAECF